MLNPIFSRISNSVSSLLLFLLPTGHILANSFYDDLADKDIPTVLSASRLKSSRVKSPAAVTILDKATIAASGARTLADIFLLAPGFQVGRYTNGDPTVAYQGQTWRYNPRIQMLIDGRPTYVPLFGGIPWSELPLLIADIERIEIIRGPNAATYGPNSFSAVISITTTTPTIERRMYLDVEAGGNEYASAAFSFSDGGDKTAYRISGQVDRDSGFENIEDSEESVFLTINAERQIDNNNSISVASGIVRGSHIEEDTIGGNFLSPVETGTNSFLQFYWERATDTDTTLSLQYYYNHYKISSFNDYTFDAGLFTDAPELQEESLNLILDKDSLSVRHELELQKTARLSNAQRVAFGAAFREDSVRGRYLFGDKKNRTSRSMRLFGHSDYEFSTNNSINIGALAEYHSILGTTVAPRLSYHHQLNEKNYLRASYSKGVRTPLLVEELGQVEFNGQYTNGEPFRDIFVYDELDIEAETSDVYELGLFHIDTERNFTLDSKFSYQIVRNMIDLKSNRDYQLDQFDGSARFFRNESSYTVSNIEFAYEYDPVDSFSLRFGYSRRLLLLNPQQILSPPKNTISIFGSYRFRDSWTLSSEYYYTSDWLWNDVPSSEKSKLERLDLRLAKSFKIDNLEVEVSAQAELELGKNTNYRSRNQIDDWFFMGIEMKLP